MASLKETIQKFDAACQILACTEGSLHARLGGAIAEISALTPRDFNPDFRKSFNQLAAKLHSYRVRGDLPDMQEDIAESILALCIKLHRETQE